MKPPSPRQTWRIDLQVPHHAFGAFVDVLDPFAQAVSISEAPGPAGGLVWHIQGYAAREPDRGAVAAAAALAALAAAIPAPATEVVELAAVDWLAQNRHSFKPIRLGRLLIHGSHLPAPTLAGVLALKIDAATAFGSGEHGSTRGCLTALDGLARRQRAGHGVARALDMGCGSGVLALTIARLWPARVLAVDLDPESVRVAAENARLNGLASRVRTCAGDGFAGRCVRAGGPYDLIAANILARPLIAMAPGLARALARAGTAVLSGLLAEQEQAVRAAYRMQGLRLVRRIAVDGWHTLVLRRS